MRRLLIQLCCLMFSVTAFAAEEKPYVASVPENPYISVSDLELAWAVARVTANEASLSAARPADVGMIWQIAQGHGETNEDHLRWLRSHSRCVLRATPMSSYQTRTNCVWSRHLQFMSAQQPEGWPARLSWKLYVARWYRICDLALRYVLGDSNVPPLPCAETPSTWGGDMDHAGAIARGLRLVVCVGTHNNGYRRNTQRTWQIRS